MQLNNIIDKCISINSLGKIIFDNDSLGIIDKSNDDYYKYTVYFNSRIPINKNGDLSIEINEDDNELINTLMSKKQCRASIHGKSEVGENNIIDSLTVYLNYNRIGIIENNNKIISDILKDTQFISLTFSISKLKKFDDFNLKIKINNIF